jgi:hypothetical protein
MWETKIYTHTKQLAEMVAKKKYIFNPLQFAS